jgi:hypothetical protein
MTEERLKKVKFTTILGAGIAMGGIVGVQIVGRLLLGGRDGGISFGTTSMLSLMKAMTLFGIMGAICGFISGMFTPIDDEKKQPTRVRKEEDEDADNEAAQETLAKLGISHDQTHPPGQRKKDD